MTRRGSGYTSDYMSGTRFVILYSLNKSRGSFHKAILATIDLTYLRLILQLPALIFTSAPRNNFKTIVNPTHVKNNNSVSSKRIINVAILSL